MSPEIIKHYKINVLKRTVYVMHQKIQHSKCTLCQHSICISFIYRRTNGDFLPLTTYTDSFNNRDEKCLLRGTDWVFKQMSVRFVFIRLAVCVLSQKWHGENKNILQNPQRLSKPQ
jgi:hypothetical protein